MSDVVNQREHLVARLKRLRNEEFYLWPRVYQWTFLGVVYLALQGAALLFFIQPLREESLQFVRMKTEKQHNIAVMEQQIRSQSDIKAQVAGLKQRHASVVDSLSGGDKLKLLAAISETAKANNLEIIELSRAGEVRLDSLLKSAIVIELEGNYHDFSRFSQHITTLKSFVVLQNFSLQKLNDSDSQKTLTARIEALTYRPIAEEEQ